MILCVDPGETTGWAVFKSSGGPPIASGQTPLWEFIDLVWDSVREPEPDENPDDIGRPFAGIHTLVVEDWALYPWELENLAWDKCRTARGIGALELIARVAALTVVLQPAKIKDAAVAGGAQELFITPRHENRHQNDAIMHGWYYLMRQGVRTSG